jgi:hypothetical protein
VGLVDIPTLLLPSFVCLRLQEARSTRPEHLQFLFVLLDLSHLQLLQRTVRSVIQGISLVKMGKLRANSVKMALLQMDRVKVDVLRALLVRMPQHPLVVILVRLDNTPPTTVKQLAIPALPVGSCRRKVPLLVSRVAMESLRHRVCRRVKIVNLVDLVWERLVPV